MEQRKARRARAVGRARRWIRHPRAFRLVARPGRLADELLQRIVRIARARDGVDGGNRFAQQPLFLDQPIFVRAQRNGGARASQASVSRRSAKAFALHLFDLFQRQPQRFQRDDALEPREVAERIAPVAGARAPRREEPAPLVRVERLDADARQVGERADRVRHAISVQPDPGGESNRGHTRLKPRAPSRKTLG